MSFFEKTTAFFNKIEEWNEEQKKVFKEKLDEDELEYYNLRIK